MLESAKEKKHFRPRRFIATHPPLRRRYTFYAVSKPAYIGREYINLLHLVFVMLKENEEIYNRQRTMMTHLKTLCVAHSRSFLVCDVTRKCIERLSAEKKILVREFRNLTNKLKITHAIPMNRRGCGAG